MAKASLYSTFGSKEELVHAYPAERLESRKKRLRAAIARHVKPKDRVLAACSTLSARLAAEPSFRGCAFLRANAEGPPEKGVKIISSESRAFTRSTFAELVRATGVANPERLVQQLCAAV